MWTRDATDSSLKHTKSAFMGESQPLCIPRETAPKYGAFIPQSLPLGSETLAAREGTAKTSREGGRKINKGIEMSVLILSSVVGFWSELGTQRNFKFSDFKILFIVLERHLHCLDDICCD